MALFGFGPFSSPVGQLIERATDNAASAGDLGLHMQICDTINGTETGPKDAVAAIKKRLTGSTKNFHIISLTLTVLETCVKNCGMNFHLKIAQKDFLQDLMKVIAPKNNPPTIVRERILGLIQYWADAFKDKPQLSAVSEHYQQLKGDGVDFPPIDLDNMAPIQTPERTTTQVQFADPTDQSEGSPHNHGGNQRRRRPARSRPLGPLTPEQVAKILSELDMVRTNIEVANEIMTENEPGAEPNDDTQLLKELNAVLHNMQLRVAGLIDRMQDESVLEALLVINDDLNTVFVRYERYLRNSEVAAAALAGEQLSTPAVATTTLSEPSGISYPSMDEGQLIDLGSEVVQPAGKDIDAQLADLGIGEEQQTSGPQQVQDEFDIFAKSRTAYTSEQEEGSTYDDQQLKQEATLGDAVRGRTTQPNEHTYSNIQDWLSGTDMQPTTTAATATTTTDSATSAEFDQFLAQRAVKGESLPPSKPRHQMQQKLESHSDDLFSL